MATSTTFKGAPKPYGASGHFDEPRRHALQAQGFKTGHLSDQAVYEQYGITNLEKNVKDVPRTSQGLEDVQAETIEEKESLPKKESFGEKVKKLEQSFAESMKRERTLHQKLKQERLYQALDKKMPKSEDEVDEDTGEDYDPESAPAKFAHFLSNLSEDYSSEDLVGLNEKELEVLAVRFKSQNKDGGLFGDPENPFLEELKKRMEAKAETNREKAQLRAELRKPPVKEKGFLAELFE